MQKLTKVFINNLSYIEILDKTYNVRYEYKPEKRLLFGLILLRTEGFYCYWDKYVPTNLNKLLKENLIIDKELYIKPRIKFGTNSGEKFTKYFDTIEDCYRFVEESGINQLKHIEII
jgi:hypothetical protein